MTTRLLLIATAVSLTMASVAAYAGYGTTGTGWNQAAADAATRAYAAEGNAIPSMAHVLLHSRHCILTEPRM